MRRLLLVLIAMLASAPAAQAWSWPADGPVLAPVEAAGQGVEAQGAVADLVSAGVPRRVAVDVVARLTDVPRNELYRASL